MIYIIYKISIADQCYIGSTKDFNNRKQGHRDECNNSERSHYYYKVYQFIRANGGWDKAEMSYVEEYECDGQLQGREREEYWRKYYDASLNSRKAYNTKEQYTIDNKDKKKEYDVIYRATNYDKIEKNKKMYYEAHKERILQNSKAKIICECGSSISSGSKTRHLTSKKHQDYLKKNSTINHNE